MRDMSNITNVKHVVTLMQENRSFDEYFGTFPGARGLSDPTGVFTNLYGPDPSLSAQMPTINDIKPFRMSTYTSIGLERPNDKHDWNTFQTLYNGGQVGQQIWQETNSAPPSIVGYYAANDIPVHWALAGAFTLCDHYFGSALSATAPNRLYLMSGCVQDPISNRPLPPIPQPVWPGPAIGENLGGYVLDDPNPPPAKPYGMGWLSWPTYADMLTSAGVSWTVYDETNLTAGAVQATNPNLTNGWGTFNLLPVFASWIATPPTAIQNPQTNTKILPAQPQTLTTQFESDAANGALNKVVWLLPPFWASEWEDNHPSDGGAYIVRKLNSILDGTDANGNPLWDSTVLIVIYDESGGHFDHVMPPAASGTGETSASGQPFGAGFRAPALVISPWTLNQGVNSAYFDHTSVLQLLEAVTNVPCVNLSPSSWRRQQFNNLADVLNFNDPPATVADVRAILPWLQPWTQALPNAPPNPTMADAYAFYANQRLQSVRSANPSSSLTAPAAQTEAPWVASSNASN
jgi:phospholipase C